MFKHRSNMLDEMEGNKIVEEIEALEEEDADFKDYGDLPPTEEEEEDAEI
jgi:hypothetical protein